MSSEVTTTSRSSWEIVAMQRKHKKHILNGWYFEKTSNKTKIWEQKTLRRTQKI